MDEVVTNLGWQAGKDQLSGARRDRAGENVTDERVEGALQAIRQRTDQGIALRRKLQAAGKRRDSETDQSTVDSKTDRAMTNARVSANARVSQSIDPRHTPSVPPLVWTGPHPAIALPGERKGVRQLVIAQPPEWTAPQQPAIAQPPDWTGPQQIENTPKRRRKPRPSVATGLMVSAIALVALVALGYEGSRLVNSYMEINAAESALALGKSSKSAAETAQPASRTRLAELSPAEAGPRTVVAAPRVSASLIDPAEAAIGPAQSTEPALPVSPPAVAVKVPEAAVAVPAELAVISPTVPASVPASVSVADSPSVEAAQLIGEGHKVLATGDVLAARKLFTKSLQLGLPEAALALGRAYDPEYLALMPNANASPDVSIASAMYRHWYTKSIADGSIAKGVQLDRLLHSMNQQ